MTELVKRSAVSMAHAIGAREVSAVELLEAHAERSEARNPQVNAIVVSCLDRAREEAVAADLAVARGDRLGALHGVPFTVKEVIPVAGLPCTNGSLLLTGRVAARDAEVIRRMRAAGAILVARPTCPSSAHSGTRSTASTEPRAIRTTLRAVRVGRQAERQPRWRRR